MWTEQVHFPEAQCLANGNTAVQTDTAEGTEPPKRSLDSRNPSLESNLSALFTLRPCSHPHTPVYKERLPSGQLLKKQHLLLFSRLEPGFSEVRVNLTSSAKSWLESPKATEQPPCLLIACRIRIKIWHLVLYNLMSLPGISSLME